MSVKQDPNPSPYEQDMVNMFTSVWVKVEVAGEPESTNSNEYHPSVPPSFDSNAFNQIFIEKPLPRQKKKRLLTKQLMCDLCSYKTVYKNCMECHMMGHYDHKPFSCAECGYTTKYPSSLHRHKTFKHREKIGGEQHPDGSNVLEQLKCDDCDYTTYFKWNLNQHRRKHMSEKRFKCQQCTYETAYRHNYVKHSRIHTPRGDSLFRCDKCPFETKYEGHIQRHLAKIHNVVTDKANMCDLCDFSTKEKWRLSIHKQRSKRNDVLKCTYCDFQTMFMCESKKHKTSHYNEIYGKRMTDFGNGIEKPDEHGNATQEIEKRGNDTQTTEKHSYDTQQIAGFHDSTQKMAEYNNDKYETAENSNRQGVNSTISDELERTCEALDPNIKKDSNQQYLLDPDCIDWKSIQVLASNNLERPFLCHMCDYTSKFKASVQRHFQRHHTGTQNRPFRCCNCDFSTKTKDQIALHNKRSQSEKQLFCNICDFTTFFKCQHVMHLRLHYPYKCSNCRYTCKYKSELTKHFATFHLGKGLKCQYCDYVANRKESILCHETVHTGIKPFNCEHCEYTSVRKNLLDKHLKRYHSEIKTGIIVVSQKKIKALQVSVSDGESQRMLEVSEEIQRMINVCGETHSENNLSGDNDNLSDVGFSVGNREKEKINSEVHLEMEVSEENTIEKENSEVKNDVIILVSNEMCN